MCSSVPVHKTSNNIRFWDGKQQIYKWFLIYNVKEKCTNKDETFQICTQEYIVFVREMTAKLSKWVCGNCIFSATHFQKYQPLWFYSDIYIILFCVLWKLLGKKYWSYDYLQWLYLFELASEFYSGKFIF